MSETDDLKETLLRLQRACAGVQQGIEGALGALDRPSRAPVPAEAPAPPPPPDDPRLARLRKFAEEARSAGVDPADAAFADRASERFRELAEGKRGSLLADCARLLGELLWKYHFLLPADLRAKGGEVLKAASPEGVSLVSRDVPVPSAEPGGTLVAEISPLCRAVSAGRSSPAAEALVQAARLAATARAAPAARGQALSELMKLWVELPAADPRKDLVLLRYAVNALDSAGVPAADPLLEVLGKAGVREVPVAAGAPFDDGYSPSQFERRSVASDAERHRILRVRQRCFVGTDGVPLQKGIVEVSKGRS